MVEWSRKKLEFKDQNDREVTGQYDEKVLEAFQKFDADGSGSISRDELAEERGPGEVHPSTTLQGWERNL